MAIDLGTNSVRVYLAGKGVVVEEPAVVAQEVSTGKIVAIGQEAREMIGRTPESIVALNPLSAGAIANYRVTQELIKRLINRVSGRIRLARPEIMIVIPAGVTSTERRAVIDATLAAGAKSAFAIKSPLAAALGAGIAIATPSGDMIIDIGAGITEVGVISLGDLVAVASVRVGGSNFDRALAEAVRKKHNLIVGEQTAEQIKFKVAAAQPIKKELQMEVSGSNSITGLPESVIVKTEDLIAGLRPELNEVINTVKRVLQKTPPELAADVMDRGIIMTGGAAKLRELDQLLSKVTGVPCELTQEPELSVVKGAGIAVEHLDAYKKSVLWAR